MTVTNNIRILHIKKSYLVQIKRRMNPIGKYLNYTLAFLFLEKRKIRNSSIGM